MDYAKRRNLLYVISAVMLLLSLVLTPLQAISFAEVATSETDEETNTESQKDVDRLVNKITENSED